MTTSDDGPRNDLNLSARKYHGRLVVCRLDELHPHPAYARHRFTVPAEKLSSLAVQGERAFQEPIFITQDHLILDGYARLEFARRRGRSDLPCLQFELSKNEALLWLLHKHRRSNGLNAFGRILLALDLEPWLRERARANQQAGGQNKGSSKLTEVEKLDVRCEIAATAGVSVGNVSKVKRLKTAATAEILDALRCGEVSIHRAWTWSQRGPSDQREALWCHRNERGVTREIRTLISKHRATTSTQALDLLPLLKALFGLDADELGTVDVKLLRARGRTIFITEELVRILAAQRGVLALQ